MGAFSVITTETRLAFAERFLESPEPEAIIYVPLGCVTLAVNKAHAQLDGGWQPFDGNQVDLVEFLETSRRRLESEREPRPHDLCYCEKKRFVDVLDLSDCSLVKLANNAAESVDGIAKRTDYSQQLINGSRTYAVHGILGRQLDNDVLALVPGRSFGDIRVWSTSKHYSELPKRGLLACFNGKSETWTKVSSGWTLRLIF